MISTSQPDTVLITAAKALRALGYGLLSVALGLHLPAIGLTPGQVGAVFTTILLGSALLTAFFVALADQLGHRQEGQNATDNRKAHLGRRSEAPNRANTVWFRRLGGVS